MTTDEDILSNIGGSSSAQSLVQIIENTDLLAEEEPQIMQHSHYMDTDRVIEVLCDKQNSFKCFSINIQSLNAKHNQLDIYMQHFNEKKM